ncbi:hypothetical protein EVAR_42070_1 [Eumeta japonica]|uniref:Uncharacterized protein n=1 Tax=Eumeta variegata TaxID=151549 RepID=A0A4C1XTE9_EUMVA|nr:hypothetical protein EVAR_42070_1 [Eumeta japonica]
MDSIALLRVSPPFRGFTVTSEDLLVYYRSFRREWYILWRWIGPPDFLGRNRMSDGGNNGTSELDETQQRKLHICIHTNLRTQTHARMYAHSLTQARALSRKHTYPPNKRIHKLVDIARRASGLDFHFDLRPRSKTKSPFSLCRIIVGDSHFRMLKKKEDPFQQRPSRHRRNSSLSIGPSVRSGRNRWTGPATVLIYGRRCPKTGAHLKVCPVRFIRRATAHGLARRRRDSSRLALAFGGIDTN